jgi:phage holin, LL-H family
MADNAIITTAIGLASTAFTALAGTGIKLVMDKIGINGMQKVDTLLNQQQTLASMAVKYSQQAYKNLGGSEKLEKACAFMSRLADSYGIKIDSDEIEGFIEAALKEAKYTFADTWKKTESGGNSETFTVQTIDTPTDTVTEENAVSMVPQTPSVDEAAQAAAETITQRNQDVALKATQEAAEVVVASTE